MTVPLSIHLVVFYFVSFSPLGAWLEASMLRHILIQLPSLILIGYCFGTQFLKTNRFLNLVNGKGIAGILLCFFIGTYWMLPRALDASLSDPTIAIMKYLSLTILVGIPLAISWRKLYPIARAVIKIEFLVMLIRFGWVYLVSPIRLCNFYQKNEQVLLGKYFLMISVMLAIYWSWQLFSNDYREVEQENKTLSQ